MSWFIHRRCGVACSMLLHVHGHGPPGLNAKNSEHNHGKRPRREFSQTKSVDRSHSAVIGSSSLVNIDRGFVNQRRPPI
eukprot:scaffold389248_cov15-Prasinocladus_malaysianus.AAC.1